MTAQRAPLAEAIELLGNAARAFFDEPLAHLIDSVDRSSRADRTATAAAGDAAVGALLLARAWWGGSNAVVDAIAILAVPSDAGHRYQVSIPPVAAPSTASVVSRTWTRLFTPEPQGVTIHLRPPVVLQPGTQTLELLVAGPPMLEPSWDVVLGIVPVGGGASSTVDVALDASTELPPAP